MRRPKFSPILTAIPIDQVSPTPLLTGDDLIALGHAPGPQFAPVLDAVYRAQLDEQITESTEAKEMAKRLLGSP